MRRLKRTGLSRRAAYATALAAFGIGIGAGWGQNQAIVPPDVSQQGAASPAAQTPGATAGPPAAPAPPRTPGPISEASTLPAGTPNVPVTPPPAAIAAPAATPAPVAAPAPAAVAPPVVPAAAQTAAPPVTPVVPPAPVSPPVVAQATPESLPQTVPATMGSVIIEPPPATEPAYVDPRLPGKPEPRDGNSYPVTEIKIGYKFPHPQLPSVDELLNSEVRLGEVEDGYVAPRAGMRVISVRLGDIGRDAGPKKIYRSGIAAIYGHILRYLNDRNIIGVFVVVDPEDIRTGPPGDNLDVDRDVDNRRDRTSLQLVIVTSTVTDVRTVEVGDMSTPNRVNDPRYDTIRSHSPLQPSHGGETDRKDLLRKDVLDDYRLRLNRVQGRRVDVAISGTNAAGEVYLDYLIANARPWYAYAQVSNTGTSQTADWRERFGFVHTQLTNRDDVLSLDYMTSGFSTSQGLVASYEFPFFDIDRARARVYGSWNDFTASDVGRSDEDFAGSSWAGGMEFIYNFFQRRELFLDAIVGFRTQGVESKSISSLSPPGKALFYDPYVGLRIERITDVATTTGQVNLTGYLTTTDESDIVGLGRTDPTLNPWVLQFEVFQSFFLEPLLDPSAFAAGQSTLAHEIAMSVKGQWAFNARLHPQAQSVAGGLYSVRGYPESVVAADSQIVAQLEYRYHIPRSFAVFEDPTKTPFLWEKAFRFSPQQPYGRPDWDLIFRAFFDVAQTDISQAQVGERSATLVGTGVGLELQIKQNFNLRFDFGIPLTPVRDASDPTKNEVDAGDGRFHITSTFLY